MDTCDCCGLNKPDIMSRDQGSFYLSHGHAVYYHMRTCEECARIIGTFMMKAFLKRTKNWPNPPRRCKEIQPE